MTDNSRSRSLSLRNGGLWMLAMGAVLLTFVILNLRELSTVDGVEPMRVRSVESYGFDLSNSLIDPERIRGTIDVKGGRGPLNRPAVMRADQVQPGVRLSDVYKITSSDLVVGVVIGDRARAYPLWVLAAHEVCNDDLDGRPFAVIHNPLSGSALVVDRVLDSAIVEFAFSGLIYNSAALIYDAREKPEDESLWCPLELRAVSGPAARAAARLSLLPATIESWQRWRARHPDGELALPDRARKLFYRPNAFLVYQSNDRLRYPVSPLPPEDGPLNKHRILAERDESGTWRIRSAESPQPDQDSARPTLSAYWFAWYAAWENSGWISDDPSLPSH